MRASRGALAPVTPSAVPLHNDTTRRPRMSREVGVWHYTPAVMHAFQAWCRRWGVRAYANVRMTRTPHFARCLRASRTLRPGQGIVTCPAPACYNFLVVAREMAASATASRFPFELNWMNYHLRLPYLRSMCTYELAMPGWMVRVATHDRLGDGDEEDGGGGSSSSSSSSGSGGEGVVGRSSYDRCGSQMAPYMHYLLQDTRGRDGIATGISREREEDSSRLEHVLSEMAADAGDEPDVFLEQLLRALACLHLRTQPIEAAAITTYMPGTNFFKAKAQEMCVPTLMPLIDAVPQVEDGTHNCMVEYVAFRGAAMLRQQYADLCIDLSPHNAAAGGGGGGGSDVGDAAARRAEEALLDDDATLLHGSGFFVLRALQTIEPGDVLYVRHYPQDNNGAKERMQAQMNEASRLLSYNN